MGARKSPKSNSSPTRHTTGPWLKCCSSLTQTMRSSRSCHLLHSLSSSFTRLRSANRRIASGLRPFTMAFFSRSRVSVKMRAIAPTQSSCNSSSSEALSTRKRTMSTSVPKNGHQRAILFRISFTDISVPPLTTSTRIGLSLTNEREIIVEDKKESLIDI